MGKIFERTMLYEGDINALKREEDEIRRKITSNKGLIKSKEALIAKNRKPVFYSNTKAMIMFVLELLLVFVLVAYGISVQAIPKTFFGVMNFLFIIDLDGMYFSPVNFFRAYISLVASLNLIKNLLDIVFDKVKFNDKKWRYCIYIMFDSLKIWFSYKTMNSLALPIFGEKIKNFNHIRAMFVESGSTYVNMAVIFVVLLAEIIIMIVHITELGKAFSQLQEKKANIKKIEMEKEQLKNNIDDMNTRLVQIEKENSDLEDLYKKDVEEISKKGKEYYEQAVRGEKIDDSLMNKAVECECPDACLYKGINMIKNFYNYDKESLKNLFATAKELFFISANQENEKGMLYHIFAKSICVPQDLKNWERDLNSLKKLEKSENIKEEEKSIIDLVLKSINNTICKYKKGIMNHTQIYADLSYIGDKQYADAVKENPINERLMKKAASYENPDACLYLGKKTIEDLSSMTKKEHAKTCALAKGMFEISAKSGNKEGIFYSIYTDYYSIYSPHNCARLKDEKDISKWKNNLTKLREMKKTKVLSDNLQRSLEDLIFDMVSAINYFEEEMDRRKKEAEEERRLQRNIEEIIRSIPSSFSSPSSYSYSNDTSTGYTGLTPQDHDELDDLTEAMGWWPDATDM